MKKFSAFMAAFLIVVLCVPSVPALADSSLIPGYYTLESVDGVFGDSDVSGIDVDSLVAMLYDNNNDDISMERLESLSDSFIEGAGFSGNYFVVKDYNNNYILYAFYSDSPIVFSFSEHHLAAMNGNNMPFYSQMFVIDPNGNLSHSDVQVGNVNGNYRYFQIPYGNTWNSYTLLYLSNDYGLFSLAQAEAAGLDGVYRLIDIYNYAVSDNNAYFNFCPENLPYYDGNNIIDPDGPVGESNINHMYFKSCEIGFAEPSGVNSYNSFGGAYFYIKYTVDDWVRTHINDYDLYFSSTSFVGSRQVNGSKRVSLDSDGCICIPFSDIFSGNSSLLSDGFVVATSNSRVEQNFYKSYLYSVSSEKLPSLIDKFNSVDTNSLSGAWDKLLDVYFGNWLLAFTYEGGTQVISDVSMSIIQGLITSYSNFKIQTQCYLIDNNDNRSGSVGRIFDLATGSDTSTDNEGLTNDNPFVDDSTGDDYLPDVPTDNNTYPVLTGQNGTYIQNNLNIPSSYTVTYRDGVNEFIDWYNQDSSVTGIQNTVWGAFGVFRDNPATDLYEEYFGFLPAPFREVILGCGTIGIVGGAACILRKRLMK